MANKVKISFDKQRLYKTMKLNGIKRSEMIDMLGIPKETYDYYMKTSEIMPVYLERISEILDVSQDYLAGFQDDPGVSDWYFKYFNEVDLYKSVHIGCDIPILAIYEEMLRFHGLHEEFINELHKHPTSQQSSELLNLVDNAINSALQEFNEKYESWKLYEKDRLDNGKQEK